MYDIQSYTETFVVMFVFFQKSGPHAKVGFSKAMSAGWICVDKKAEGGPKVTRKVHILVFKLH